MIKLFLLLVLVVVVGMIVAGIMLIRGSYQPFKDKEGNPTTLSSVEKVTLGVALGAFVIAVLAIFLPMDHPWIRKLKGQKS